MDQSIRRELARLFPDHPLVEVPLDHPIYHLVYDFPKGIPKIHEHDGKPAQGFGIFLDGRLVVYYSYQSDLGDGWEDPEVHHDPPEKREAALRMGVNLFAYAWDTADDRPATARALHRLARPLRHRAGAGWLGLGVGAAALLLGLGAWAVELGWIAGPGWVLLAWAGSVVPPHWSWPGSPGTRSGGSLMPALPTGWRSWARGAKGRSPRCSISLRGGPAPRCWTRRTPLRRARWSAEVRQR